MSSQRACSSPWPEFRMLTGTSVGSGSGDPSSSPCTSVPFPFSSGKCQEPWIFCRTLIFGWAGVRCSENRPNHRWRWKLGLSILLPPCAPCCPDPGSQTRALLPACSEAPATWGWERGCLHAPWAMASGVWGLRGVWGASPRLLSPAALLEGSGERLWVCLSL